MRREVICYLTPSGEEEEDEEEKSVRQSRQRSMQEYSAKRDPLFTCAVLL
jgi:hypothetical protein